MNVQESFVTALDGSEIYLRKWLPEGDPRGIQIAHGMTEHAGVYRICRCFIGSRVWCLCA